MNEEMFNSKYIRSLAILGGSFDPIHYGHLRAAETVKEEFNVDKVIFLPTGRPPHKSSLGINDLEHRYLMTVAATLSNPNFEVSRIELEREGTSYTVDTLTEIRKVCPADMPIYFIVGADSLVEMSTWREPETLFSLCSFIALARPGTDMDAIQKAMDDLKERFNAKIYFLQDFSYPISSTEIREKVRNNTSIKYYLPENVETYIKKNGLYIETSCEMSMDLGSVDEYLRKNLSPHRYNHTQGVADQALKLAKLYGADEDKAYIAGLLHDIAKEIPLDEKLTLCAEYGIEVDEIMRSQPDLTHSFLSAAIAKSVFGIDDNDMLNAISYHTTGRHGMSMLEKILLLADITEPDRGRSKEIDELRKLSQQNLNKAVYMAIKIKLDFAMTQGKMIHPLSHDALTFLEFQI